MVKTHRYNLPLNVSYIHVAATFLHMAEIMSIFKNVLDSRYVYRNLMLGVCVCVFIK